MRCTRCTIRSAHPRVIRRHHYDIMLIAVIQIDVAHLFLPFYLPYYICLLLEPRPFRNSDQPLGHIAGPPPSCPLRSMHSFLSRDEFSIIVPSSTLVEYIESMDRVESDYNSRTQTGLQIFNPSDRSSIPTQIIDSQLMIWIFQGR